MATGNYLINPLLWLIPWALYTISYFFVLKKMGLRKWTALIPFLADHEMTTVLFRRTRAFWRPAVIGAVFMVAAYYLGPNEGTGFVYMTIAQIVYQIFLIRLYYRLAKSFGKGLPYTILMILLPVIFISILGLGRSRYTPLQFKPEKPRSRFGSFIRKAGLVVVSAAEILILVGAVGFATIRTYPPRPIANSLLNEIHQESADIWSDRKCLTREDTMGTAAASVADMPVSRDKFFPDHSDDNSVVVMEYIIGADLEDRIGAASANIRMMQDATKQGDGLTFVLEAGGSRRWFTSGITENGYGRYTVKGGKVEKAEDRDLNTMESPEELEDFIKWTAENYPADRYMLVLWDHGGGVPYGYGVDQLAHRTDTEDFEGLRVSEIAQAIANSGVKFDVIGFDACLMQDIETASALAPYADYYLASEETEGGFGWYYTSAFGELARNPGTSSEDFGKDIISTYDQFNRAINDDEAQSNATLSFIDLTRVEHAYKLLTDMYGKADSAIREDSGDFAELGLAAMNAYTFSGIQTDAVDFISKLSDTDVDDSICTQKEREDLINAIKACVVFRNRDSAEGINGMAIALPYQTIGYYADTAKELNNLKLDKQTDLFDDIFSIIAVQKKAEHERRLKESDSEFATFLENLLYMDYTQEDWYVKGFEDYDPTTTLIDIPLTDTGAGWQVQLPDKTWDIIADCRTAAYQKTEDGSYRYLGNDHIGDFDTKGHPMVDMDDMWVHINGHLAYYDAKPIRETEEGTIYSGDTTARLNGKDDIIIHIEWGPEAEGEYVETGKITGYDFADDEKAFMKKGSQTFQTGDSIEFLFDYYDENGNPVGTDTYGGRLIVTKQNNLVAKEEPLPECDIQFLGILTDVYQRELLTEVLEAHIGE